MSRGVGIFVVVAALTATLGACGGDKALGPPQLSGRLWRATRSGTPLIVYVAREPRSRSVSVGFDSDPRTERFDRYALLARRVPDGVVVAALPLGDVRSGTSDRDVPQVIGVVGDVVWVWRDSVEARSLDDLSLRATASSIVKGAAESPAELPKEAAGYKVAPDTAALIARGRDARFYRIDLARSSVEPIDPATLPPTTASMRVEDRFDHFVAPGQSRVMTSPANVLQRSFLTSAGTWYALLSESERAMQSQWPEARSQPSGEVARSLYRAQYRLDDRREPELALASLTTVGTERLIQAGFLVRHGGRVWDVADPSSTLVLARKLLGETEPWDVVRLARDGSVVWRTSIDLADPGELLDLGSHIVFAGQEPAERGAEGTRQRERIVWIDERTGAKGASAP